MKLKYPVTSMEYGFLLTTVLIFPACHASIMVELKMPRFATVQGDVLLVCDHNIEPNELYKVDWLRAGSKIFQYIKGRIPPYRNFTVPGAVLDWQQSSEKQIRLVDLDFAASGVYSCEVSTETPIYTKPSNYQELTVIEPQGFDPVIRFLKGSYQLGDALEANCTTSPARPPPHITWFINKQMVADRFTKPFPSGQPLGLYDKTAPSSTLISMAVSGRHVDKAGHMVLTCLSTIPAYVAHNLRYADQRQQTVFRL